MRDLVRLTAKLLMSVIVVGVTLLFGTAATAASLDDGVRAFRNGQFATAFHVLSPLARQGETEAQFFVAVMYDLGRGVTPDHERALRLYERAAEKGHAAALFNIGTMYENGRGIAPDFAEAMRWYRRAAEQGVGKAQNNIGAMFAYGRGVPQDYIKAYMWYSLAAAHLPAGADRQFTEENREGIATRMTPDQVARAQQLSLAWETTVKDAAGAAHQIASADSALCERAEHSTWAQALERELEAYDRTTIVTADQPADTVTVEDGKSRRSGSTLWRAKRY